MSKKKSSTRFSLIFGLGTIIGIAIIGIALWTIFGPYYGDDNVHGLLYEKPELAADFALTDQNNNLVSLSDFRGKVVLIYFGFTNCPDQCPITLGLWNQLAAKLGNRVNQVQFLFVTVDPERDTPEVLNAYLSKFTADVTGLTGTVDEMEDVMGDYSVFAEKIDVPNSNPPDEHEELAHYNYWVNHTALTFVIDKDGKLVMAFPYATSAANMVVDLQPWLN